MLPLFLPPVDPSPGTDRTPKLSINAADFGDGYSQPVPAGINHIRKTVSLVWNVLLDDHADDILDFLEERGGCEAFLYQPPRVGDVLKWTCEEWSDATNDDGTRKISATLKQSFTLVE